VRPTAKTRKRRRRRRLVTLLAYIIIVFALAWFFESQGTTTIIFVRHAEVDAPDVAAPDSPLNQAGTARAEFLANYLERIDIVAGVDAIYVDSTVRTQETAAPLAGRLGLEPQVADHDQIAGFMKNVLFEHKRDIVLIITQRDDIAPMVEELHGSKNIAEIGAEDYDELFIVSIPWFGKVKTLYLPYGAGFTPPRS
jgi:phosphohistidine phosphatase SixA